MDELIDVPEVMRLTGLSLHTVRAYTSRVRVGDPDAGQHFPLPHGKDGCRVLYSRDEIQQWLRRDKEAA